MQIRNYGNTAMERLFGIYSRKAEILAAVSMSVLLLHWLLVLWFIIARLGSLGFLRLHYTAALGVDWIDAWWKILLFPGFGLLVFFVNGLLSGVLSKTYRQFGILLMSVTVFLQVIFAMGGVMVILLNG